MNMQDVFYTILVIGIITIVICAVYTTYFFVKALKSITNLLSDVEEAAQNVKNGLKIKALAAIPAILLSIASKIIRKRR